MDDDLSAIATIELADSQRELATAMKAVQLVKGDKGDAGARGPVGLEGKAIVGPPGQDGRDGKAGAKGPQGATGPSGKDGQDGKDGVGPDEKVRVSPDDPKAGFLADKLTAGFGIGIRTERGKGGERLIIDTKLQSSGGGGGGGAPGIGVYDDGVGVGFGSKVSFDGGDPVTIAGGIIHVPVGSGGGGGTDDQTAAEVPFTPVGTIAATDTQAAVAEVATDAASALSTHEGESDPHPGYLTPAEGDAAYAPIGASALAVSDEAVALTAGATSFDFVGAGVTAAAVGTAVTVTVAGSSGLPAGGTEGQALVKQSGVDGDAEWEAYVGLSSEAPIGLASVDYVLTSTWETIPPYTYDDGASGVGATVTQDDPTGGVLTADSENPMIGDRILFYESAAPTDSGVYVVTDSGDGATVPWVLTRATDCDTPANRDRFWVVGILSGSSFAGGHGGPTVFEAGDPGYAFSGTGAQAVSKGTAAGQFSWAEGENTLASGPYAHAEGENTIALTLGSHAEGVGTLASQVYAHTEGLNTVASGQSSHAEGSDTIASGLGSHTEGRDTIASGDHSHAEGRGAVAHNSGEHAHASGLGGQYSRTTLNAATTDDTPTDFQVNGAGPWGFSDYSVTAIVRGRIVARSLTDPDISSAWDFTAVIRGDGSTAYSWVGGAAPVPAVIAQDAGASGWAVEVGIVDDSSIAVTVTGEAATDIDWMATLELDEVRHV